MRKLNLWKKFEEFAIKLDKVSIRDWGTVEKVQQRLEKGMSNTRWNFEKKYSEKVRGNFKIIKKMFKKLG